MHNDPFLALKALVEDELPALERATQEMKIILGETANVYRIARRSQYFA